MHVRLCQLDGALPNYALLRLAHWHRERGDVCHLYMGKRATFRGQGEPDYGRVYASTIFTRRLRSSPACARPGPRRSSAAAGPAGRT